MQLHLALLDRVPNQDRAAGKAGIPSSVFGMEMRRCQEQLLIAGREFGRHPRDGRAIARSKARIDHQRRPVAGNDSNVGPTHNRPNMLRHLDRVLPEHRLILGRDNRDGKRPQEK